MSQQNYSKYRTSVANNILLLAMLLAISSAIANESKAEKEPPVTDEYIQELIQFEGMGQASVSAGDLAQSLFDSLGSKGTAPTASNLFAGADKSTDRRLKDIQFVFGLMVLSLDGKNDEARKRLQKYQPHLTYMDELPADVQVGREENVTPVDEAQPKIIEVLSFAYAWLINNTEVTVPCWFIKEQTEIYDKQHLFGVQLAMPTFGYVLRVIGIYPQCQNLRN